jgi:hypothetical protein
MDAVRDLERFRQRLAAAGVDLPPEVADLVAMLAGPMVTALDDLAALDLADLEPFSPALRLAADAG